MVVVTKILALMVIAIASRGRGEVALAALP